jgi:hypothetical protein
MKYNPQNDNIKSKNIILSNENLIIALDTRVMAYIIGFGFV